MIITAREGRSRVASAMRLRQSRSRIPRSEKALTIYTVVLVALIYGTPALIASRDGWGAGADSPASLAIAGLALSVAFFVAGRSRGPSAFSVADIDLLLAGPAPRTSFARWRPVVFTIVFASVGALIGAIVLAPVQPPDPGAGAAIVGGALGGAGLGVGALLAWILGESDRRYGLLALPATALTAWALADPSLAPWAMAALPPLWSAALVDAGLLVPAALVLVVLTSAAFTAQRILLARTRGEYLRRQADRWDRARSAATTLDLRTAAGVLGDRAPRYFRRMPLSRLLHGSGGAPRAPRDEVNPAPRAGVRESATIRGRGPEGRPTDDRCREGAPVVAGAGSTLLRTVFARDLIGGIRRWPDLAVASAFTALGSGILAAAPDTNWSLSAVALVTVGTSRAAGGLRTHAENLGRPNHLDPPTERAAWAHLALPAVVAAIGLLVGLIASAGMWNALAAILVDATALALLIPAAYRFRPPSALMGPINTPAGDMSAVVVVAWWIRTHLFLVATWWLAQLLLPPARLLLLLAALLVALLWARRSFLHERRSVAG